MNTIFLELKYIIFQIGEINNDFKQMKIGKIRTFKIDISKKIYCGEKPKEGSKAIKIEIRKVGLNSNDCRDCSQFEMVGKERDVYLTCKPGYFHVNVKGPTVGCGISQILIQLCLNEPNIHEVKYNGNQAMRVLKIDNILRVSGICKKIVYMDDLVKPLNMASLYLKAAILGKFNFAFIKLLNLNIFPSSGFIPTELLLEKYDGMGGMVNDDKIVNVEGTQWFFCRPCKANKCTIS